MSVKQIKADAANQLALGLQVIRNEMIDDGVHLLVLLRCMKHEGFSPIIVKEVKHYFKSEGCCILNDDCRPLSRENIVFETSIIGQGFLQNHQILSGLESTHWLMANNPPGEALERVLTEYKPGHKLVDQHGRYWVRRSKMCFTRYRNSMSKNICLMCPFQLTMISLPITHNHGCRYAL